MGKELSFWPSRWDRPPTPPPICGNFTGRLCSTHTAPHPSPSSALLGQAPAGEGQGGRRQLCTCPRKCEGLKSSPVLSPRGCVHLGGPWRGCCPLISMQSVCGLACGAGSEQHMDRLARTEAGHPPPHSTDFSLN